MNEDPQNKVIPWLDRPTSLTNLPPEPPQPVSQTPGERIIVSTLEALEIAKEINLSDSNINQTTQMLAIPFRVPCDANCYRDYTQLEVCKTRVLDTDPGTVVWSLTGPVWLKEPRKVLSPEELNDCLIALFYDQASEIDPPEPKPKFLFGNYRWEDACDIIRGRVADALATKYADQELTAIKYFHNPGRRVEPLPQRPDGSIDYENLCGEFLVEGVPISEVKLQYNQLPEALKRVP